MMKIPRVSKSSNPWQVIGPGLLLLGLALIMTLNAYTPAAGERYNQPSPPTATPTLLPGPFECETGINYNNFEPDSTLVTQVCPAHKDSITENGMLPPGPLYIVIHNTGTDLTPTTLTPNPLTIAFQGNIDWFQDPTKKVSIQYMVGLDDDHKVHVIQMAREADWAWHAGEVTELEGNQIESNNSIGIEVVGMGTLDGWPADNLYSVVGDLVADIASRHNIDLNRIFIVGHEEISITGKPDPGPNWDWQRFMETEVGGDYTPAVELTAGREVETNRVTFTLRARNNLRTGFRVEASEDEGSYQTVSQIGFVANKVNLNFDNPRTFELTSYIPPVTNRPLEICYRTITVQDSYEYINPSSISCIIHGLSGESYADIPLRDSRLITQNAYPIVKPSQEVVLSFTLQNTGILSWKPDGRYVLINTGGDALNLPTRLAASQQTYTLEQVTFEVKFTAPAQYGAYTTIWQMAYIDPESGKIELFGDEIGALVSVLPEGASVDFEQLIQGILDNAVQSAEQSLQDFLLSLKLRIQEEIEEEACRTAQQVPCLAPLFCMVGLMGVSFNRIKKRAKHDNQH
jgi:N-acetyl-anhydromuramyl-L-alanine amidase AmpD